MHKSGFHGRHPRIKPFISKVNKAKRINYTKKYENEDINFWENVLFTDESKLEIFGEKNEELAEQNIQCTEKHGGGSVMVWRCFSASAVGDLDFIDTTMNDQCYVNFSEKNLAKSVSKLNLPGHWIFQQDNDPKHTSRLANE